MKKQRVVVAMSGGVDSSVAAALLQKEGYEVIGITMCFNLPDTRTKRPGCCGWQGIEDARRVAQALGIRHYVVSMQKYLREYVIDDFCREYLSGRTPNPCVRCNQYLKFDILLKKALALGAEYLATGHYARIGTMRHASCVLRHALKHKTHNAQGKTHNYYLMKARDRAKDQSYFLYRLNQEQLRHIIFPLGDYTKVQVRGLAHKFNLPVADKPASQEICFLPEMDYRKFLQKNAPGFKRTSRPGPIIATRGKVIGRHRGIAFYTIGQRQGLRVAMGVPLYITRIDPRNNSLFVGSKEDAMGRRFLLEDTHFVANAPKKRIALKVKIRYNHPEAPAYLERRAGVWQVRFIRPQFAITSGQSAVFYLGDRVIGGGIIAKAG